ncbi:arsenic ABC transporter ATPase [Halodesulfurarchaeum formicicum]|uniref:Arsenic ABC transporter ATPase n=1 Tax=Halodesulfurarchaeum formicicum TaxID=1873524 RepID=A0A1D8S3S3_9EURY|nr:ArsA family ATPase [Halodesulfurarchaeum formicicum]AOW80001.1 arsenic ABC transporter ATPase [Halodesulfurarchaeum formicicum]
MESLSPLVESHDLIAFTGKGGVGKTTSAAATAVHLAEQGERTLLLSTDRSPSLSDILGTDVGGEVTAVPGVENLDAIEMDFDTVAERWKEAYGEEVYAVVSSFMPVDRWVIDYFAEAPGIATQFALSYLLEFYEGDTYDRIVWDTAPAGATIGLIELEEKLYEHLGTAPKFYAKLRAAISRDTKADPSKLLDEWRELAQDCLAMVQSDRTTFLVVTNPEKLAVDETQRITAELEDRGIAVGGIVANGLLSESLCDCSFHQDRVTMQREHLAELESVYSQDPGLVSVPQFSTEVAGVESLREVGTHLFT